MSKFIRISKTSYIVMSIILCILGLVLMINPAFSQTILVIMCAILLIAFGMIKLFGYFSNDLYRLAFQYDLPFGILLIVLGIIILVRPGGFINFICIALGLSIFTDSMFKMHISNEARKFGIREWYLILIFAVLACICGITLMVKPSESGIVLTILLGANLLVEGILSLITVITSVKIFKEKKK